MRAQIVWTSIVGPRENACEVHTADCIDASRTAVRQSGNIERVNDFPDNDVDQADMRYMCYLAFSPTAFENGEMVNFTVMPCVRKERLPR